MRKMMRFLLLATPFLIISMSGNCSEPAQQRPGGDYEGSAHWARDIAQPLFTNFASDAELHTILGVQVWADGRLPSNKGSWGLVSWSASRQEEFQVNVKYNGSTTTATRANASPPSANDQSIPNGWVNSTVIFDATEPHRDSGATLTTLVAFNISTYSGPYWGLNFNAGQEPNHYINWDGTYLGTTPN